MMCSVATMTLGERLFTQKFTILSLLALFLGATSASADTVYVSLDSNNTIATYDTNAISPTPKTFVSTGPNSNPAGLAFDSSGNLYSANSNNSTIGKFTPGGVGSVFAGPGSGVFAPEGLAIDSSNNVFAGNIGNSKILELSPSGVGSVFATGVGAPFSLAFNSSGNLFVANGSDAAPSILEFTPGGVGKVFASTMLSEPSAIAFDSHGNLFVTNYTNDTIVRFTPDGTGTLFANTGSFHPFGLAIDSSDNLFVTNAVDTILKITPGVAQSVFAINDNAPSFLTIRPSAVPEPGSLVLIVTGLTALLAGRRFYGRLATASSV